MISRSSDINPTRALCTRNRRGLGCWYTVFTGPVWSSDFSRQACFSFDSVPQAARSDSNRAAATCEPVWSIEPPATLPRPPWWGSPIGWGVFQQGPHGKTS